ncbi:hypothetical protein LshimejAT787_1101460 [Lyophyllum shimeji]|uniref:Uncharacterized protein n=1 Tax=Lyophyllum shimeji TaxID=47721 RepID=A0A9P3UTG4_LYOSH|nr:hypothetical protein LshimejAT787_1101460 [Lyophyllum shimeji]
MYQSRAHVVLALIVAMLLASLQIVAGAPLFRSPGAQIDFTAPAVTALPCSGLPGVQTSGSSSVAADEPRKVSGMPAALNNFISEWMTNLAKPDSTKRTRSIRRRQHTGRHP